MITAKVLQIIGSDQARISIGGQSIDVQTQVPLQAGQSLQLAVSQTPDGIRLAVVPAGEHTGCAGARKCRRGKSMSSRWRPDAANNPRGAGAERGADPSAHAAGGAGGCIGCTECSDAAGQPRASVRQSRRGVRLDNLPPQLQQAVAQVLAQRPSLDQNLSGADVQQAFASSGLFLEASLASGAAPSATTPDLKAALIVLRQVLTTTLSETATTQGALPQATLPAGQGAQPDVKTVASAPLPNTRSPAPVPATRQRRSHCGCHRRSRAGKPRGAVRVDADRCGHSCGGGQRGAQPAAGSRAEPIRSAQPILRMPPSTMACNCRCCRRRRAEDAARR